MTEILLCNRPYHAALLEQSCGIPASSLYDAACRKPSTISAFRPYLIGGSSPADQAILNQLSATPVARELTHLSLSYGGDNVVAISEAISKLSTYGIGFMEASTGMYTERMGGFVGAIKGYQDALMEYRAAIESNSPTKAAAKQKAYAAFQNMQTQFRHEIDIVTAGIKAKRGLPLADAERAANIARDSRNIAKLNLVDKVQANNLVKFSQNAKYLGNGLAVIDFGSRIGNIRNSYEADGNWEREMFVESSSFAASAVTGGLVLKAGLGLLVFATPFGWAGLIVGGVAVAGAAAVASVSVNRAVQGHSGSLYDKIMNWISF